MDGDNRINSLRPAYYTGSNGIIISYSVINKDSFNSVLYWSEESDRFSPENISKILVGYKYDDEEHREVIYQEGKQLADSLGVDFFEVSAKRL